VVVLEVQEIILEDLLVLAILVQVVVVGVLLAEIAYMAMSVVQVAEVLD
jgi:hypothetical protein